MMPTFPEYRNKRRQTDRKEVREEKQESPVKRSGPISLDITDT
jgi:hypothetical protein